MERNCARIKTPAELKQYVPGDTPSGAAIKAKQDDAGIPFAAGRGASAETVRSTPCASVSRVVVNRACPDGFTFAGTDSGGMRGRQPSGREISVWGVDMLGFRDGMIVSNWIGVDWLGLFVQIGAVDDPWA